MGFNSVRAKKSDNSVINTISIIYAILELKINILITNCIFKMGFGVMLLVKPLKIKCSPIYIKQIIRKCHLILLVKNVQTFSYLILNNLQINRVTI